MTIWKLGCNWGSGTPSFFEFIREKKIIIGVDGNKRFNHGDYILVTQGHRVKAIARLLEPMKSVTTNIELKEPFGNLKIEYKDLVMYAPVQWKDLDGSEEFDYRLQQGICRVHSADARNKAQTLVNKYQNCFHMNYWIFQGNPAMFDFHTAIKENLVKDWTVSAHKDKIKTGDKLILWIVGNKAGCYGLGEITHEPRDISTSPDGHLWKAEDKNSLKAGMKITHNLIDHPILWNEIKQHPDLQQIKVGNQGTNFSATEAEYLAILSLIDPEIKKTKSALNQILYGPPGTGKTYKLQRLTEEMKLIQLASNGTPDLHSFVSGFAWWQLVAMALLEKKRVLVPDLLGHPLIKAKLAISNIQHPPQRLWGTLQHHTVKSCPHVKFDQRFGELIFYKEADSSWRLDNEPEFRQNFPFLVSEWEKLAKGNTKQKEQRHYTFVTCHQSLTYEDFVEGIKPALEQKEDREEEEKLQYQIRKGLFYQACEKAAQRAGFATLKAALEVSKQERKEKFNKAVEKGQIHVLFLDEINRCNVSAVFGELITLIEDDKRLGGYNEIADIALPYSQTLFGVPANLYIIGTMNTADRSVEALDTALRRRFVFEEMNPKPELLNSYPRLKSLWIKYKHTYVGDKEWVEAEKAFMDLYGMEFTDKDGYEDLKPSEDIVDEYLATLDAEDFKTVVSFNGLSLEKLLCAINERLQALLTRDHTIGHAWLMDVYSLDDLRQAFKNKILPLLQEYFYNNYAKVGLVLGNAFIEQKSAKGIFAKNFTGADDFKTDYEDRVIYTLKDPFKIKLEEFKDIYKS